MKRVSLFITIGIIILVAGVVWLYQNSLDKRITPWDLIGDDAAIVIELNSIDGFNKKIRNILAIQKIVESSKGLTRIIESEYMPRGKVFLSVHPVSIDDFGIVIYIESSLANNNLSRFDLKKGETSKKRVYNGIEINELLIQNKIEFSFAEVENIILMSSSSFLLEGAIRLRSSEGEGLFKNSNSTLFRLPTLKSDEGNAYLNISNFIESTELFLQPLGGLKRNNLMSGSSLADVKLTNDRVLMNGFALEAEANLLTLFKDQEPQSLDFAPLVSNRVASVANYGFSNPDSWFARQKLLLEKVEIKSLDSLEKELSRLSVDIGSIRKSIGNQLSTCFLNNKGNEVTIVKLANGVGKVSVFDELASKISMEKRDSLYVENYAGYQIKLIDYRNFLHQLFYPLSGSSDQSYFVRIGSHLILAENVELIKIFIDDIDNENTWGKSVEWNKFLGSSLPESNLNLFFDGKLAGVYLRDDFNSKWKTFFDTTSFIGIDKGSVQLSRLESNYYLNAALQFANIEVKQKSAQRDKITFDVDSKIVAPITLVTNHTSKDIELIVIDTANNLLLLSKNLKVIWKRPLDSKVVANIEQIDFLTNGKLQYLFIHNNSINLIDRLGRNVDGFPRALSSENFEYSSVVDYDRSKRYRYLMTDIKGNLTLTDKQGIMLDGWNPRQLGGRMINAPRHYRVLGKDYFIALQQNGIVNLLNRRGEMVKGFPLDLGIRPSGEFYITVKNSFQSTYFTVVSNDGMKVEFGLDGQIRKKEALIKRTGASKFTLCKSSTNDSFVYFRVDPSKLAIFDSNDKAIFEVENQGSTEWKLIYLENRLKERYYCFYDENQNFSYLYDSNGSLALSQPIESTQMPTLHFDEKNKSLSIFYVNDSQVNVITLKK